MAARKNSHPVLRMPLDLSVPVDLEVYNILYGFKSAIACKNFLLSAVLYYARSPLVVSANALIEALDRVKAQGQVDLVMGKLEEVLDAVKEWKPSRGSVAEGGADFAEEISDAGEVSPGSVAMSALLSLKQQFRV
jgi:hypothetical protein